MCCRWQWLPPSDFTTYTVFNIVLMVSYMTICNLTWLASFIVYAVHGSSLGECVSTPLYSPRPVLSQHYARDWSGSLKCIDLFSIALHLLHQASTSKFFSIRYANLHTIVCEITVWGCYCCYVLWIFTWYSLNGGNCLQLIVIGSIIMLACILVIASFEISVYLTYIVVSGFCRSGHIYSNYLFTLRHKLCRNW